MTIFLKQMQELIIFIGIYIYLLSQSSSNSSPLFLDKLKNHQILLFPSWFILTFWFKYLAEISKSREHISLFL